jgi:hypothetical protein
MRDILVRTYEIEGIRPETMGEFEQRHGGRWHKVLLSDPEGYVVVHDGGKETWVNKDILELSLAPAIALHSFAPLETK